MTVVMNTIFEKLEKRPKGNGMTDKQMTEMTASADHFDNDAYSGTRMRDRALNAAIIRTDISNSYEEYLEIFDEFYADDVEASDERRDEPIRGKARARSLLMSFLVPLHVMAEVCGLSVFIRETPVSGDVAGERTRPPGRDDTRRYCRYGN
jgi:hypothetical protein